MVVSDRPPRNGFVKAMRKVYNPIGFAKGYNFVLWFIFDGALLGFLLARVAYMNFYGVFCAPPDQTNNNLHAGPGECYTYLNFERYTIGIQIHLYTIMPAGLLAVFQFVPVIRHKIIMYHRVAGYIIALLVLVSNAGAVMIADRAFGGSAPTQVYVGVLAILTTSGFVLAIWNVKKLQIDQHRAWMLRTWAWMGTIVTVRLIFASAGAITAAWPAQRQHVSYPCDELISLFPNATAAFDAYPACNPNGGSAYTSSNGYVSVTAILGSSNIAETAAGLSAYFGMSGWLALVLHTIAVEVYLKLTAENERLRQVSYERQLERGMANAGYAGLVAEKLGDSDGYRAGWQPKQAKAAGPVRKSSDDIMANLSGEEVPLKNPGPMMPADGAIRY